LERTEKLLRTTRSGKLAELAFLNGFFERLALTPKAIEQRESPDFLVTFATDPEIVVGCELTLYFADYDIRGSAGAHAVAAWKKFSSELDRQLRERGLAVEGTFWFREMGSHHEALLAMNREHTCLDEAVALIESHHQELPVRVQPQAGSMLSAFVESIAMAPEAGHWWASHLQSGRLDGMTEALPGIVAAKAESSLKYDWAGAEERWLVIVADALQLETTCILDDNDCWLSGVDTGTFNRVWLWDGFLEQVWLLHPELILASDEETKKIRARALPERLRQVLQCREK